MLYKIVNHTVQVPQEYHPTSDTSKYNTRSSNNSRRFTKYQPRLNAYLHSFFPRTVNRWNSLQNEVVTATGRLLTSSNQDWLQGRPFRPTHERVKCTWGFQNYGTFWTFKNRNIKSFITNWYLLNPSKDI